MTAKERMLEETYQGKMVSYDRFPHPTVYGRIERMGMEDWKNPVTVVFVINDLRYSEDIDDFESLIKLL